MRYLMLDPTADDTSCERPRTPSSRSRPRAGRRATGCTTSPFRRGLRAPGLDGGGSSLRAGVEPSSIVKSAVPGTTSLRRRSWRRSSSSISPRARSGSTFTSARTVQNLLALRFADGIFEPIWTSSSPTYESPSPSRSGSRAAPPSTSTRARSATSSEPPAPAARDPQWSRRATSPRESVRNEKVGAPLAAHAGAEVSVVRGAYGRGFVEGARWSATARRKGGAGLDDGDVRCREALRRQLAVGGHPVLRADGEAAAAARDDHRDQFKRAPHPPFETAIELCGRTCC